ncbi:AIPR family protein [Oceanobacillus sojae]|uniref:AIPR family protein n=1 Tax=Oceanobacillus sojae TaxID=582851 RepID=UPI00362A0708
MIKKEIEKIVTVGRNNNMDLSDDKAFDILMCALYCYQSLDYQKHWYDLINSNITDGSNDGGIDFVYFDEDEMRVVIGQNKYSNTIKVGDVFNEIKKIDLTINDFNKNRTQEYNKGVRKNFRDTLDRLTDEYTGNIDIVFSSLSLFDSNKVYRKFEVNNNFSELIIMGENEIVKMIEDIRENLPVVKEYKFDISGTQNKLKYASDAYSGVVLNISANSLKKAFDKFETEGLFNLNIRRFIKAKNVDDAIKETINKKPSDFWFLNNGLTIACKDYHIDGNNVKIYDFSIVNGGQTTTLIAKNLPSEKNDFYLMCKIVKSNEELDTTESMRFFNNIAEATNSQKPIQPRDLKANAPEMVSLQRLFEERDYYLEIKRGLPAARRYGRNKIKNEELAQLFFSFVVQKPGTARSNKKALFSNNANYKQVFMRSYAKNKDELNFLIELVNYNNYLDDVIQRLKDRKDRTLDQDEMSILSNGKQCIVALTGFIYRIVNNDFSIKHDNIISINEKFNFGNFISNYREDDIEKKITDLVVELTKFLKDEYAREFEMEKVTSPSNFMKTDKKYLEAILKRYIDFLRIRNNETELLEYYGLLFKRNE